MTVATLTGCSTVTARAPVSTATIDPPVTPIPEAPEMPAGLPRVCLWPSGEPTEAIRDYHCTENPRPRDVVVPPRRYDAIRDQLDDCGEYHSAIAGAVDDCNRSWQKIVAAEGEAYAAKLLEEQLEAKLKASKGWPPWMVGLLSVGVGLGATATGILIGYAAGWLSSL